MKDFKEVSKMEFYLWVANSKENTHGSEHTSLGTIFTIKEQHVEKAKVMTFTDGTSKYYLRNSDAKDSKETPE